MAKNRPSGSGLTLTRGASGVDAAFIDQKPNEAVHCGIVGAANERRRLTLLSDQARQDQPMQVVRKRRGGDPQFLLQMPDRQPIIARPNERSIDLKARGVAERFELFCGFFDFHGNMCSARQRERQCLFRHFWKLGCACHAIGLRPASQFACSMKDVRW